MDTGVENTRELPKEIDINTDTREILARANRYAEKCNFKDWLIVDVDAHHSEMASWKTLSWRVSTTSASGSEHSQKS